MKISRLTKRISMGAIALVCSIGFALPASAIGTDSMKQEPKGAYVPSGTPDLSTLNSPFSMKSSMKGKGNKKNQQALGPANPSYTIDVDYNSSTHKVAGTLEVTFKNNIKNNLSELYFNLWGNAEVFKENGGGMNVSDVKVNGKNAAFEINETALHIKDLSLSKNKKATVSMDFEVSLPEQQDRFGWYGETVSMGNWFPILAVYDDEGWNVDPYYPYGESFYSLSGKFDVTVTTDKNQVIAATGEEVGKAKISGDKATHRYKAKDVRDFALEMNPNYRVISTEVNNIKVNVYYSEEHSKYAAALLESGEDSIKLFSEKFGQYPWPELDIVTMEGWFGGMEYPQLVMISLAGDRPLDWAKSVNAHEIGHQWFYGIIGNNEYDEPWLDESFASFAAALYDGELDSLQVEPTEETYYHLSSQISDFTARADEGGIGAYYYMIYNYGSSTINDLRELLGDEAFYSAMQTYFKQQKFGISTTRDFIASMEKSTGRDLMPFFRDHRVLLSDQE
ncbi:M1 family metallopeptidase [Rossellomorea vietnamensis]|uniref:M1 family metallopeptidase n=1 Tax=Rossellomorea vietnamensis TaxID=218284 RepID=UPI001CC9894E|nr:M1 family metallopeptidase [Rossellomorea vietnamensis]MCA0150304.1 M1 family metallopeptidase [Rossellomorea vietnamensis]